jgi:glutamine synthetase
LDPGKNPQDNAIFLSVLASVIRAIDLHADMLRASTAHFGNDHRLGALEAPPAIISIFLGDELTEVINRIEQGESATSANGKGGKLRVGVDTLPPIPRDTSDRNRTSPFAFTGNKFEFRAPGSSQNCSGVCMALNTIVSESIDYLADEIAKLPKESFHEGLEGIIQRIIREHGRVIFNGDGYSIAWVNEAKERGLPNLRTVPEALAVLLEEKNLDLFAKRGVLSPTEMRSRYDVFCAEYARKVRLEGKVALETARSIIEPAVMEELGGLARMICDAQKAGLTAGLKSLTEKANTIGCGLDELHTGCEELEAALDADEHAILRAMTTLRTTADALETITRDTAWPLPKYRELLQIH